MDLSWGLARTSKRCKSRARLQGVFQYEFRQARLQTDNLVVQASPPLTSMLNPYVVDLANMGNRSSEKDASELQSMRKYRYHPVSKLLERETGWFSCITKSSTDYAIQVS